MLLAEPQPTPYDLHFRLLGIGVRVAPWFWIVNVLLGWSFAKSVNAGSGGEISIGAALLIWTAAVLVSIVIHEMGHALAFRYFGVDSHIVLYQFGGMAVPEGSFRSHGYQRGDDPKRQIVISLAGPLSQILAAVIVIAILFVGGFITVNPLPFIHQLDFLEEGRQLPSLALRVLVAAFTLSSIWWALLNLLPVYPLDGGQISREVITLINPREGIRYSLIISIGAAVAVAVWGFTHDDTLMGLMFLSLAYSSYMTLQAYFGGGRGFGGGQW